MACTDRAVKLFTEAGLLFAADSEIPMPTLFRLLFVLGLIAGIGYAVVWSLANFVEPSPRPMTIIVPQERIGQ